MVLCDRGPPTIEWLDAPDQGVDPRAQLAGGDQTNILPLDLTLFFKLNLLYLVLILSHISA